MPVKDLFDITLTKADENIINAQVKINKSHPVFKGHFPGNPVTPGVMQLMLVKHIIEKQTGKSLKLKALNRAKFLAVLNPNESPVFNVEIMLTSTTGNEIKATAKGWNDKDVFFKFSALYQ